ncbi:hypothetical protein EJB05_35370, partial [Eragrostis curvula]
MDAARGGLGADGDAGLIPLLDALAALGATTPQRVCRKKLSTTDLNLAQARLLIPRANGDVLAAFLTAGEKDEMDSVREERDDYGISRSRCCMDVPVFDRHGHRYDMMLRCDESGRYYRLIGPGWVQFVRANGHLAEAMAAMKETGREMEVELWAFRSKELPFRCSKAGCHPDGSLGFAILVTGA